MTAYGDRVVAITGAGRGIGRAEAIAFARAGAKVVVNSFASDSAQSTVAAIAKAGGIAVACAGDIAEMATAKALLESALDHFGRVDVLLNNAGIVRDRMLVNMTEAEWDDAIRTNLRGTFTTMSLFARHWRETSRSSPPQATIINTTSAAGLYRNLGQANYGAAKAGIANLTVIAADELARYGITVNAIAPAAATDMSAHLIPAQLRDVGGFDPFDVDNIAPLAVWLGSMDARSVTGRIFDIKGGRIGIAEGWMIGPSIDIGRRWAPEALGSAMADLLSRARPNATVDGIIVED